MAATQRAPDGSAPAAHSKTRKTTMDEMFSLMASGFLRGGIGFLKSGSGELLKTTIPQEVRVGVTQVRLAYGEMVNVNAVDARPIMEQSEITDFQSFFPFHDRPISIPIIPLFSNKLPRCYL